MNPIFQHRHYKQIAAIIAQMPPRYRKAVIEHFAQALTGTNARFDRGRFESAARGEPCNGRDR